VVKVADDKVATALMLSLAVGVAKVGVEGHWIVLLGGSELNLG
jgi:hypothetical protein